MTCGACGQKAKAGVATTSGDLDSDRFIVKTPDGSMRTFAHYADAVEYKKQTGGTLSAR